MVVVKYEIKSAYIHEVLQHLWIFSLLLKVYELAVLTDLKSTQSAGF